MSYRITEEISSFWNMLALPILFGGITFLIIWYILSKEDKEKIVNWLVEDNKKDYVLENGIYIPYSISKKERLKRKIINLLGNQSLISIFLVLVIMFGLHRIVNIVFQPQIRYNANVLLACGISEELLAVLWYHAPNPQNFHSIMDYLESYTDSYGDLSILYELEAYIRFYILVSILTVLIGTKKKEISKKKEIRYKGFKIVMCLFILLGGIYLLQVQANNKEYEIKCQAAYHEIDKEQVVWEDDETLYYFNQIITMKNHNKDVFYYGAYSLRIIDDVQDLFFNLSRYIETKRNANHRY